MINDKYPLLILINFICILFQSYRVAFPSAFGLLNGLLNLFGIDWKICIVMTIGIESLTGIDQLKF